MPLLLHGGRLTSPTLAASSAPKVLAVRQTSLAQDMDTPARGRRERVPMSAARPMSTSLMEKRVGNDGV